MVALALPEGVPWSFSFFVVRFSGGGLSTAPPAWPCEPADSSVQCCATNGLAVHHARTPENEHKARLLSNRDRRHLPLDTSRLLFAPLVPPRALLAAPLRAPSSPNQVNEVVLCGKISIARGGGAGAGAAGAAAGPGRESGCRSGSSSRAALALERWAEALRALSANVVAKASYR